MKSPGRHLYNLTNWPLTQLAKSAVWPNSPDELPSKENNDDKMLINDVFQFFKNFHAPGPAPPVPRSRSRAPGPAPPVPRSRSRAPGPAPPVPRSRSRAPGPVRHNVRDIGRYPVCLNNGITISRR